MIISFSDGTSSQFKQKFLFSNLEYWETKFKYKIHRHFFATSCGKGVVGDVGGSVKGLVYQKILTGAVIHIGEEVAGVAQGLF